MKSLKLIIIAFLIVVTGCKSKDTLSSGDAVAIIDRRSVKFMNAQAGTTNVMGMYSTLSIVFGAQDGQGFCITLAANKKFEAKEYKVKFVERPDIENAQITYNAPDHKIYEAVGRVGFGSVIITELTDSHIKGIFSGNFVLQGATNPVIEIKNGEFNSKYTPTPPEF